MNTIILSTSLVRTLNVALNANCQKQVRDEAIATLRRELWDLYYNPDHFDIHQNEEEKVTLFEDGPEWVKTTKIPCSNVELTYKFYCFRNRLGWWYCDHKSLIIKTARGILVL